MNMIELIMLLLLGMFFSSAFANAATHFDLIVVEKQREIDGC